MNSSNNLTPFANNGLELVIDTNSGESFASQSAVARMCEVSEAAIRKWITSNQIDVIISEINTATGLKTSHLLAESSILEALAKYNPSLLIACAQAGLRVYLHKLAGFEVKSTSTAQNSSDTGILNEILKTVQSLDRRLSGVESKPTASPSHEELPQSILNIIDRRDKKQQAYITLLEIRDQWCKTQGIEEGALGDYSFCEAARNGQVSEVLPLLDLVKFGSYTGLSRATLCRARKRMKDSEAYRNR
jgi:hypothetical protein